MTADGDSIHASNDEHVFLFWALRGGGGNFGIVTSFEYRLHPVGPTVLAGAIVHPLANAHRILTEYRGHAAAAPDAMTAWVVLRKASPLPFLDASVHGQEVLIPALCHAKDGEDAEAAARPFREIGTPHADAVGPCPFTAFQQAFDPLLTPGARNNWKSHNFGELSDGVIDTLIHYAGRLPSDETEIFLGQLGGPANRVKPEATAYPHRDANFVVNLHTRWRDPAEDQRCIEWTRALFADLAPWATGGVYVNIMPDDETGQDRLRAAYGPHCRPAWPAVRPGRTEFESLAPRFDNLREPAPGAGHGGFPLHSMQVWHGPRLRGHPE